MVIPRGVNDVDEPHTALDHAPGQQAIGRESAELARAAAAVSLQIGLLAVEAVHVERRLRFAAQVDQLGRGRLHAESQLVAGNAAGNFRIEHLLVARLVQPCEGVESLALERRRKTRGGLQVQHRLALVAEQHAGVDRRQKAALPERSAAARPAPGGKHDVAGQIARLATQPIGEPRAHARQPERRPSALHEQLSGVMVELVGVHAADEQQVVGH